MAILSETSIILEKFWVSEITILQITIPAKVLLKTEAGQLLTIASCHSVLRDKGFQGNGLFEAELLRKSLCPDGGISTTGRASKATRPS